MSEDNSNNKSKIILISAILIALAIIVSRSFLSVAVLGADQINVNISDPREDNGGIPVNLQDQATPPIMVYLNSVDGSTTLTGSFNVNEYVLNVSDATGLAVGDYCGVFNTANTRFYVGNILAVNGLSITMDTPSDFNYSAGDVFQDGTKEMNVDGSVVPQYFSLRADPGLNLTVDITRIIIHMTDQSSMDDAKFGGISALTRGVVLRKKDGFIQNIFNVKSNGEFGELAYDKTYDAKAPAGFYGFSSRLTFGGQSKIGVVIRLGPTDDLQLIVQDDLTGLDSFRIMAEGHIVTG